MAGKSAIWVEQPPTASVAASNVAAISSLVVPLPGILRNPNLAPYVSRWPKPCSDIVAQSVKR
jgi:hypothetical protein